MFTVITDVLPKLECFAYSVNYSYVSRELLIFLYYWINLKIRMQFQLIDVHLDICGAQFANQPETI